MSKTKEQLLEEVTTLKEKYDTLRENLRCTDTVSLERARKLAILEENFNQVVKELGEAKEKVLAQEARIMVLETAMTSMALHIQIMIDQKKRSKS